MIIAVFGASGRTGLLFMKKALDAGHSVVAYARHPDKITFLHERLKVIEGTMEDTARIGEAVRGADAVVELMGAVSEGTNRILSAMREFRVRRLIAASALSVHDREDRFDPKRLLLIALVKAIIPRNVKEVRRAAALIRGTDLDWTIVRIPVLDDKAGNRPVRSGYYGRRAVGMKLTRAGLAQFLIDQLSDKRYIRKAPAISS